MTTEHHKERTAPSSPIPWLVAAGALVVYLATLNHWITMTNGLLVFHATGWSRGLPYQQPLLHLLTLPLQWLPPIWTPLLLNALTAVLAALTLAVLARSVMMLPQDRTRHQRYSQRSSGPFLTIPQAWLPPVLAALVCGLELTFWQNSISATGEMLDLLIFACLIWSLLKYRLDKKDSRLFRFALIYGIGATNNYALIGYFPAFLVAIVWIKGIEFFNGTFLLKALVAGLVGLCLYLVLPTLHVLSDLSDATFFQALKANLGYQKSVLLGVKRYLLLIVCLPSVFPVLFLGIRWASRIGDTNSLSLLLTELFFPFVHTLLFILCNAVALFSAYHWTQPDIGVLPPNLNFLTFYYLGALSVGYFAGYLLLVFGGHAPKSAVYSPPLPGFANILLVGLVWVALLVMPVGLVYRNFRPVLAENSQDLKDYATQLVGTLPAGRGVALCDDARRLLLVLGELVRTGRDKDWLVLNTRQIESPAYNRYLHRAYPQLWPEAPSPDPQLGIVDQVWLVRTIADISTNLPVYYLHPSFGYYSEAFHLELGSLSYKLAFYPQGELDFPPPTADQMEVVQKFWQKLEPTILRPMIKRVGANELNAVTAGSFYSRSLVWWGVRLQVAGQLPAAAAAFKLATELYPDNVVAQVNLSFNAQLQKGAAESAQVSKSTEERLGKYRSWQDVLNDNGPFDEPVFCFECGNMFFRGNLIRQAGQQYRRAAQLRPNQLDARLMLTQVYLTARRPALALATIREVLGKPDQFDLTRSNKLELTRLEIAALTLAGDTNESERVIAATYQEGRRDPLALQLLTQTRMTQGRDADALVFNDELLKLQPDAPEALLNKAALLIQLARQKEAVPILDQLLAKNRENAKARLNRAIAQLQLGDLEAARRDYEALLGGFPDYYPILYGLAEIGERTTNRDMALKYYRLYLKNAPPNTPESARVRARTTELEGGK